MNSTRTLAALAFVAVAVIAPARAAAATPTCDGTAAFEHVGYTLNGGPEVGKLSDLTGQIQPGDTLVVTSKVRPECAGTTHSIAFYGVAEPRFDEAEVQHIITATPVDGTDIVVPSSTTEGQCQVQIDDITGPALSLIDGSHRYNEQPIGGTRNRLVLSAGYTTDAVCDTLLPPTSAPVTVTTTAPPTVDVPLTEAPTTTAPVPFLPGAPVPSTPVAVVGGDPVPLTRQLPVTGANSLQLLWGGAAFIALGGFIVGATRCRKLNKETSK